MTFGMAVDHYTYSGDVPAYIVDEWHEQRGFLPRGTNPLKFIGYHYLVRAFGAVELGRSLDVQPTHCPGYNRVGVLAICYAGWDKEAWYPSDFQYRSGAKLHLLHDIPKDEIYRHDQLYSTHCPGRFDIGKLIAYMDYFSENEKEVETMLRISDSIGLEHHYLDVWTSKFKLYWLHIQARNEGETRVYIYATKDIMQPADKKFDPIHNFVLKSEDNNPNPYIKIPLDPLLVKAGYTNCAVSVHASQPIACALREELTYE